MEFLTTNGTSYNIEKIIIEAQKSLVLVSPYLQLSKTLFERLKDADNKGVRINIIYGKDELKPNEKDSLSELKNLSLYYFQNLHAKCYFNEKIMVITSMNMYEFSEKNNREMGVLILKEKDNEIFNNAVKETKSIIFSSEQIKLGKIYRKRYSPETIKVEDKKISYQKMGYCIRCENRINFNPEKPYCTGCFVTWAQYENYEYIENVCHNCGKYEETSMNKPECYSCFKKTKVKENSW